MQPRTGEFTSKYKRTPLNPEVYKEGSEVMRGTSCRKNRNYPTRVPVHERRRLISARGRDLRIMGVTDAKNAGRP